MGLQPEPKVAVVIPCYNESAHIGELVRKVRERIGDVLVVDDGSKDETSARARAAGAKVLREPVNRGKGAALRSGLGQVAATGCDYAIVMDGDGQHDPADLPKFLDAARSNDTDLVVGNRMGDTAQMPWLRRAVNRWMSRRISHRLGCDLPDTQCGFRLIRLAALRTLSLRAERFEVESEMLVSFVKAGFRVRFVPVQTIYKKGQSKIHPVRDAVRWFRWWLRGG